MHTEGLVKGKKRIVTFQSHCLYNLGLSHRQSEFILDTGVLTVHTERGLQKFYALDHRKGVARHEPA